MFEVVIEKRAWRELQSLPPAEQKQILHKIFLILRQSPFPKGKNPKRLVGESAYRLRMGNYRVLYTINGRVVQIYAIAHRKDVYR